jgi:hypothetical protein
MWTLVDTEMKHNRLSHTSTQVGSYLFIIGGHNGQTYTQDVLLLNLGKPNAGSKLMSVTLQWESKTPRGIPPPGRGYHVAILHDARIFISGGYNGEAVFEDLWVLDLSANAYLPQVVRDSSLNYPGPDSCRRPLKFKRTISPINDALLSEGA